MEIELAESDYDDYDTDDGKVFARTLRLRMRRNERKSNGGDSDDKSAM